MGFPAGSEGKEYVCNAGNPGSIPGLGRSPGQGNGYPLQCSGLPGEFRGLYSSWGHKELAMTERLSLHFIVRLHLFGGTVVKNLPALQEIWV